MEVKLNKSLYKIELYILKVIPTILMFCYFINTILSYYNINTIALSILGGLSIIPLVFLYLSSFVFKFCVYHRIGLYYIFISDIINWYDYEYEIDINVKNYIMIQSIAFVLCVCLIFYMKASE